MAQIIIEGTVDTVFARATWQICGAPRHIH
jgi:hypothetical protein